MSHCSCCSGFHVDFPFGYSLGEARQCPGCGHEGLEAQLAEVQAQALLAKTWQARAELFEGKLAEARAELCHTEIEQALDGRLPSGYTPDNATAVGAAYRLCAALAQAREKEM